MQFGHQCRDTKTTTQRSNFRVLMTDRDTDSLVILYVILVCHLHFSPLTSNHSMMVIVILSFKDFDVCLCHLRRIFYFLTSFVILFLFHVCKFRRRSPMIVTAISLTNNSRSLSSLPSSIPLESLTSLAWLNSWEGWFLMKMVILSTFDDDSRCFVVVSIRQ